MKKTSRYEIKYRLSQQRYYQVKNELVGSQMDSDYFSRDHAYLVRSLYFDSNDYQAYHHNLGGVWGRVKLRIRSYSELPTESLSVELKTKKGGLTVKYSTFISLQWYEHFMTYYRFPRNDNPVLIEFERQVLLKNLRPKVLVQYHRDGFRSRTSKDLRITFDHQVCSMWTNELFPNHGSFKQHLPSNVVLEVKYLKQQPLWVRNLVHKHGLHWVANSKYAQSIELVRPDVIYPAFDQSDDSNSRISSKFNQYQKLQMRGEEL